MDILSSQLCCCLRGRCRKPPASQKPPASMEVINIPVRNPYLEPNVERLPILKIVINETTEEPPQGCLCRVCQAFGARFQVLQAQGDLAYYVRSGAVFDHQKSVHDLKTASARQCPFCQLLLTHLESVQHGYKWFQEFYWKIPEGSIDIYRDWLSSMDDRTRMHWSVDGERSPAQRDLQFVPLSGL
jgi:hypothetical protein